MGSRESVDRPSRSLIGACGDDASRHGVCHTRVAGQNDLGRGLREQMNERTHLMLPGEISLSVIDEVAALHALVPGWRDLLRSTPGSCAYQSPEWVLSWFAEAGRSDLPHVVVMHRDETLIGVAPFAIARLRPIPSPIDVLITAATEPGDYGDPLFAAGDEEQLAAVLVEHLCEQARSRGRAVAVRRIDEDGALYRGIVAQDDVNVVETSRTASPITRFADWDDPADEIERLAAALKLPKMRRRAERDLGPLAIETTAPPADGLELMAELHIKRFGAEDAPALLRRPRSMHLLSDAMVALDDVGVCRMCRLSAGDTVASLELGHNVGSRWVGQAAAFDPAAGKYRPGYLLVHGILERALAEGAAEYDHGQGVQEYKTHWSTHERRLRSVVLTRPGLFGHAERFMQRCVASRRARSLLAGDFDPGPGAR